MVAQPRGHVRAGAVLVAAAVLAGAVACTSGSPQPSRSPQASASASGSPASLGRFASAPALLAQCAITRGVKKVISSAERYNHAHPASQRWLHDTAIRLTAGNGSGFTDWYQNAPNFSVGGKDLFSGWARTAADQDMLPQAVCGPGVSARQVYDQVYAQWPSMKNANPW